MAGDHRTAEAIRILQVSQRSTFLTFVQSMWYSRLVLAHVNILHLAYCNASANHIMILYANVGHAATSTAYGGGAFSC